MNKKGFKGFGPGLICLGKQYAEHTTFEEKGGEICRKGMMHYCVNPFNVLDHYPLINEDCKLNEFAEVEAMAEPVTDDGKEFATFVGRAVFAERRGRRRVVFDFSFFRFLFFRLGGRRFGGGDDETERQFGGIGR